MAKRAEKEKELRDYFIDRISAEIPYTVLNGHREDRLPNNINFCFRFVEGESVLIMLDQAGICASSALDAQIPAWSSIISTDSPSTNRKQKLILLGSLSSLCPFNTVYGISADILSIK